MEIVQIIIKIFNKTIDTNFKFEEASEEIVLGFLNK